MADHHPPHIYLDATWYVITASTCNRLPFLRRDEAKGFVREQLKSLVQEFSVRLLAWVILDNHYHLLLKFAHGEALPLFFKLLHGRTSRQVNQLEDALGRQVWHNYWDTCIDDEAGLWTRFNYIHYNPVKHGYVRTPEAWPFSSYRYYVQTRGQAWMDDCVATYPVLVELDGDTF